jgi:hypothetical protein
MRRCLIILLCLVAPFFAALAPRAAEREYLLATASPGGTFYPVGVALATLVKVALQQPHGIALTAVTTAGSAENVRLLRGGELQFAILQGLVGSDARAGRGVFSHAGPDGSLRSLTALWPNVEQFVIRSEFLDTGTIDDLLRIKGRRVVLGDVNSGTLASSQALLGNLGAEIEQDYDLVYLGYGPAADAMQSGDVAGIALPAGMPTKSLARLKAAMGESAVILGFTEDQARRADRGRQLWQPYRIPANTYPGQPRDIMSIAQPNFLAARADVGEEDVYLITRAIYENLALLQSMHDATEAISLENALSGLPMPLHPGAARYFMEKGLEIPSHLVAK